MDELELPRLYNVEQVGQILSLSRSAIYREINSGALKAVKIGKCLRVRNTDLNSYIDSLYGRVQNG